MKYGLKFSLTVCSLVISSTTFALSAEAEQAANLVEAFTKGTPDIAFRYRYGHIDDAGFAQNSKASTLRTMIGYRTKEFHYTSGYIQFRNVTVIGKERYNDTLNGQVTRPPEADPEATEVDQAYVKFNGIPDTSITVGRRKLKLGNQRFISDLGWRQNNRSFDGAVIENWSLPDTKLTYAYAYNVNRAFTDKSPNGNFDSGTNVHLFNAVYKGLPYMRLEGYSYLLDLEGTVAPPPHAFSSATFGANIKGSHKFSDGLKLHYTGEYAHQVDYADNPRDYSLDYYRIEGGLKAYGFGLSAGLEVFDSDGVGSFAAPLGLLHAFGGWADKFLPAPATGMEDYYLKASYKVKGTNTPLDGTKLMVHYHDFKAENGGAHYGDEWDAGIVKPFGPHYMVALHYANYNAKAFSTDAEKVWLTLQVKY